MVRVRLVTTPIWSQDHLLQALGQMGFPAAEVHPQAVPLVSWRGIPLGGEAEVIVRREQIGAAGDDFGFVRNARGSFDALISEIHFFRFDRRWLEDLARRHDELAQADGLSAPSGLPDWERRELNAPPPPLHESGSPPAGPRVVRSDAAQQQYASRARTEAAAALDDLRKRQKQATGPGCLVTLVAPILVWVVLGVVAPELRDGSGFFMVVAPLVFALAMIRAVQMARRTRAAAAAMMERLPSSDQARAAAESFLESKLKPLGSKTEDPLVRELLKAMREPKD